MSNCRLERIEDVRRRAIQQHFDKHGHSAAKFRRIYPRLVTQNETVALQALSACENGGWRQRNHLRELQIADAAILLQGGQDFAINGVDFGDVCKFLCGQRARF